MDASLKLYCILLFVCVSVCLCIVVGMCVCMHVHAVYRHVKKDNQVEVRVFSSYHVGLGDPTQFLRLGKKCLYLLNLRADHMDISFSLKYFICTGFHATGVI